MAARNLYRVSLARTAKHPDPAGHDGILQHRQLTATQLLVTGQHVGLRKTRVVAAAAEGLSFDTAIVELAFDERFHPASTSNVVIAHPSNSTVRI